MRKSLCFCFSFLFIFVFSGCGKYVPPEPCKCFSAVADVLYGDMEIVCEISASGKNNLLISVTYPDNLRGFSYLWRDGIFRIGYRELYCENSTIPLPDNAFAVRIGNFINDLYTPESYRFTEKTDEGCCFVCDETKTGFITDEYSGNIKSIEFDDMKVELRDYKDNQ